MTLTPETSRLLDLFVPELPVPPEVDAVYLGGSRGFGLDNALSDLDVTLIPAAGHDVQRVVRTFGEVFAYADVLAWDDLLASATLFRNGFLPDEKPLDAAEAVIKNKRPVVEALLGHDVLVGERLAGLRRDLSETQVRRTVTEAHCVALVPLLRDVDGARRSGDLLVAATAVVQVLEHALEAALAATGAPLYGSRKFLWRRIANGRLLGPSLPRLWAASTPPAADRESLEAFVGSVERLALWIAAAALLATDGVEPPEWVPSPAPGSYRAGEGVTLIRTVGGYRLAGGVESRLGPHAALLWHQAQAADLPSLTADLAARYQLSLEDAERFCRVNVSQLVALGALVEAVDPPRVSVSPSPT